LFHSIILKNAKKCLTATFSIGSLYTDSKIKFVIKCLIVRNRSYSLEKVILLRAPAYCKPMQLARHAVHTSVAADDERHFIPKFNLHGPYYH